MSNKIFRDMIKPQARLSSNGFDRSYLHNFTAKIGELLPVMCIETVPGSHYEIQVSDLMRTLPMNDAAFIRASQHFEFYFVPYKQLWRRWDDFFTTRSVPTSATSSLTVPQACPCNTLSNILGQIRSAYQSSAWYYGDLGEYIGHGADKIANLLGYCGTKTIEGQPIPAYFDTYKPNLFRAAAYQKICFDYYRQPFYDLPYEGIQFTFNLDDADLSTGVVADTFRDGDNSTQPRLARLFQLHYRQWKKDLFTGVLPDTQFGAVSIVSTGGSGAAIEAAVRTEVVTHLRNTNAVGTPIDGAFDYVSQDNANGDLSVNDGTIISMTHPTGLGNVLNQDGVFIQTQLSNDTADGIGLGTVTIPASAGGSFSVLSLCRAQALQKWREITLRSGFRNVDQYRGHFGVTPVFTEKDKCLFLDSVSSPLQVNSVLNTNAGASINGQSVPLGDMGANGTSVINSNRSIKFDAKDFGIIMCIYSVLPEATYDHFGIDLMNQKILKDDFFQPEFENIGMQAVPMSAFRLGSGTTINGYAARYFEYKVGTDVQSAEFRSAKQLAGGVPVMTAGAFDGWSPARDITLGWSDSGIISPRLFARDLYVSPLYYKDIFTRLPFSTDLDPDENRSIRLSLGDSQYDSFIHQCYFDVKCVQPMSVLGMPAY